MQRVLVTGGSGFIGSHLMERLISAGHDVINVDVSPPSLETQMTCWRKCDITNKDAMLDIFSEFRPTRVIHLAAKASLQGTTVDDFPDNTIGTANIIEGVNANESVSLFSNISTQYVVRPGILPQHEEQLVPYTAYGESKAEAEKLVRRDCRRNWIIVRPTNIWGPRHPFFPYELWRYLQLRYYVHPGYQKITKYYCYVTNAVSQLMSVALASNVEKTRSKVFYLADRPIDSVDWMNGFSRRLSGRNVRRIPHAAWFVLAKIGDFINAAGVNFPVKSERLFRLTVSEQLPNEMMIELPSDQVVSLEAGIRQSVDWYLSMPQKSVKQLDFGD